MRNHFLFGVLVVLLGAQLSGCKEDYFDQEQYDDLVKQAFPVENIDPKHTWATMASTTVTLSLSLNASAQYSLLVYDRNPFGNTKNITLLWNSIVTGQQQIVQPLDYRLAEGAVYVAVVDQSNLMRLYKVPVSGSSVQLTLSDATAMLIQQLDRLPDYVAPGLRYLFEKDFPESGDFDFNDLVLTVVPTIADKTVTLQVSVDAVGCTEQLAAAIRVVGLKETDVVSCTRSASFDEDYPFPITSTSRVIKTDAVLLPQSMKHGTTDVVVNVFSNAHWAMWPHLLPTGSFMNYYFNTKLRDSMDPEMLNDLPPRTVTYTFQLKSAEAARRFCVEQLDVFMVREYNGGFWEVHTMPWKTVEVLEEYASGNKSMYGNKVPWALCVPAYVRYPFEQHAICTSVSIIVAPYQSFAKWATDHTQYADWYDQATADLVYH